MTTRRGARPPQVRPRPPSYGRPTPAKVRQRAPAPTRSVTHRRIERGGGLPILAKLFLVVAVLALGGAVLYAATGGLGRVVASLGSSLAGLVSGLTATPTAAPTNGIVTDAPVLSQPVEPYTNLQRIDLVMTVPQEAVGREDATVRLYLAVGDQTPAPIDQVAVPTGTPQLVIPVALENGSNTFHVTLVTLSGESEPSASVRYVLDRTKPRITIRSPRDGQTVNGAGVQIVGKTQGRSHVVIRNEANGATINGTAGADGSFELNIPLKAGTNGITIVATDPAGNENRRVIAIQRGTGQLTAQLSLSIYRVDADRLPDPIRLEVLVNDPDGRPLEGASVTFTLSIPGVRTFTADATTAGDGRATFRTTVPRGAHVGQGIATVLVRTRDFGRTTDRTVISVVN